jgi:hypothetical protein
MTRMAVYFVLGLIGLVFLILFASNKYPFSGYKECNDEQAKNIYRRGGSITSALLTAGFVFMGFYDLSKNLNNELIVLEGFGLFSLLFGVISLIFFVLLFHNRLIEVNKEISDRKEEIERLKEYSKNLDNKENK